MTTPRSTIFDDIYFSPEDGPAETNHVFLQGNNLPDGWRGHRHFTIGELGFGTGLNFLLAAALFEETASPDTHLDYVAVEKYPLTATAIETALRPFAARIGADLFARFLAAYPPLISGFHRIMLGRVHLTLVFDDIMDALPQMTIPRGVNAWFLDGFAPAKNPDMWQPAVFAEMVRLSAPAATCATFTVAGVVKRGLAGAGFAIEKRPGFGRKREMLTGALPPAAAPSFPACASQTAPRIAIIGGGLAGTATAWALRARGLAPVLYERHDRLAAGASGNPAGLCNPRLSAVRTAQTDVYAAGYARALRLFPALDPSFAPRGNLHLAQSADRERKFSGALTRWGWDTAHMRGLDAADVRALTGQPLSCGGVFLPDTGLVCPATLCHAYAVDTDIRLHENHIPVRNDSGWRVGDAVYDHVVMAHGAIDGLPLEPVRGQITFATGADAPVLPVNLCYGGYAAMAQDNSYIVGATFQRGDSDPQTRPADDSANLEKLAAVLPALAARLTPRGARAAIRCAAQDRFPVAGLYDGAFHENGGSGLYVNTAHGSHGLVTSLAAAQLIADMITASPRALSRAAQDALDPQRFVRRATRRQGGQGA